MMDKPTQQQLDRYMVDWVRWIVAGAVSAVLVVIASTVTGRNTSKMSKFKSKFS